MKAIPFAGLALLLAVQAGPSFPQKTHATTAPGNPEPFLQQVIVLTNAERAKQGLPPLKRQDNLDASAAWMAQDLADKNYFDHTDSQGRSLDPRLPDSGYKKY